MPAGTAVQAGRNQPQTTAPSGVSPTDAFVRASQRAQRPGYYLAGSPAVFGGSVDAPLPGAPGYLSYHDILLEASGGANDSGNTVAGNTAPSNNASSDFGLNNSAIGTSPRAGLGVSPAAVVNYVNVQDAWGTTIISGRGYEMLFIDPLISDAVGVLAAKDLRKWPSANSSGIGVGSGTAPTGNWRYHTQLAYEGLPGFGLLGIGDASLQPRLHMDFVNLNQLYSTQPATAPTLHDTVDEGFYGIPQGNPGLRPPGLGATFQKIMVTCNPQVGSGGANRIQVARLGGKLVYFGLIARNANNQRDDAIWPAFGSNQRIRVYYDGVNILDEFIEARFDKMYSTAGGLFGSANGLNVTTPPAGVLWWTYKDFESQASLGRLDNGAGWRSTRPGTLLEVECTPWGTFSNGPAQITAIVCLMVPGRTDSVQSQSVSMNP